MSEEKINIKDHINVSGKKITKKSGSPTSAELRARGVNRKNPSGIVQQRVAGRREHYTEKQKMEAVCSFAVCGNSRRVAEITKIPEATIRAWKQTEWWYETTQRIAQEENEELDVKLTKLINKAVENVNDRLENGDMIYDTKRGQLARRPMSGKDTAIVAAITLDKRQLLRGQPTSRVESVSQDQRLLRLAEQFQAFAKAKEVVQDTSLEVVQEVISAE
jgi:hypothetical protein